jgi:hypothetical protein
MSISVHPAHRPRPNTVPPTSRRAPPGAAPHAGTGVSNGGTAMASTANATSTRLAIGNARRSFANRAELARSEHA